MPEQPDPRPKPRLPAPVASRPKPAVDYAELQVTSNFSFLRGGSHPEELVARAAELGHHAIALTDINSLAGIVRAHVAARDAAIPFIVGCHVQLKAATGILAPGAPATPPPLSILVYPTTRAAYGRLCRMLTLGKRRAAKGACDLTLQDLLDHQQDCLAIVAPPPCPDDSFPSILRQLRAAFDDDRLSLRLLHLYDHADPAAQKTCLDLAKTLAIPLVATNDVYYHTPERLPLQDVLACIRQGCTIHEAGFSRFANAERHLKTPEEMARLFRDFPRAIARTVQIADRAAAFSLNQLRYEYPAEICPPGQSMMDHLIGLTWRGARERYPHGIPASVQQRLAHEFDLIGDLNYPAYFLTVADIVHFARSRGILCQGRGAAANSAVCYCLGVTAVDPARIHLLVERFISRERDEPPDIDIDFEHERREEVIQYLYAKYGRHRAALTAEVITYRSRSALRDVGKALGLSLDCVDRLAKSHDWWQHDIIDAPQLAQLGLDPRDPTIAHTLRLAKELLGFPRHLSQHVGGFIITQGPLCESVPIENAAMPDRTIIEWDKDDIDALGMLKVDILALGMLTAIRKALDLVNQQALRHQGTARLSSPKSKALREPETASSNGPSAAAPAPLSALVPLCLSASPLQLHTIPPEDPAVYDMLCRADSVGVFQVESRAQMTMLPRLKPRSYYDLVIEVAIVRPGPIQGNMVHPYLRRRNGEEPITYPNDQIREVLGRTLGIPLFQEQAMRLVMVAAGFSPGQADQLRRAMAAWKRKGDLIFRFGKQIIAGMLARGYAPDFAQRCFDQIQGFSEYGFPESHAASFALLVYASAWLKKYHPAAFAAALLNSQPMGFYQPAQLVRDAREHHVQIRPIDINFSRWDATLENTSAAAPALRLGMRLVKGLRQSTADAIAAARARGPFTSLESLWRRTAVPVSELRKLAEADAFNSLGLTRQTALWNISQLRDAPLPIFDQLDESVPSQESVPCFTGHVEGGSGGGAPSSMPHTAPSVASSLRRSVALLPPIPPDRAVVYDYAATGLSLKAHPISFLRPRLGRLRVTPAAHLADPRLAPAHSRVSVAGLILVRQRPATASGMLFITLEDETGVANLIVRPPIYEQFKPILRHAAGIIAHGTIERQGAVVHLLLTGAQNLRDPTNSAPTPHPASRDFH